MSCFDTPYIPLAFGVLTTYQLLLQHFYILVIRLHQLCHSLVALQIGQTCPRHLHLLLVDLISHTVQLFVLLIAVHHGLQKQ